MKPKTSFELYRWAYYLLYWFIAIGLGTLIIDFAVTPALRWLLYDASYRLPTWNRVGRFALYVVFMSLFAGTITWFHEKKSTGR